MADVEKVEVVVAHSERATLRVGDVFLKIDADQTRIDVEVEAMAMVPVPTPEIRWRKPPVLALAALPGTALGHLGEPSTASSDAWAAAGATVRRLHDAPLPPWPGRSRDELASRLAEESEWLVADGILPADVVTHNRRLAETALRPRTPVFIHGDLQVDHVFVVGDEVTGIIDWSEASQGDAHFDLATLTLGHPEHLGDVVTGYGTDVDDDLIQRVVVVAMPDERALVGRARLRPGGRDARGRGSAIPGDLTLPVRRGSGRLRARGCHDSGRLRKGKPMRRLGIIVVGLTMVAGALTPGVAGAAVRHVDGGLTGPSSFSAPTCDGGLSDISGTGTFAAKDLGIGTYAFSVCVSQQTPLFDVVGTVKLTTRSGAKIRGTIAGIIPEGQNATYTVTVTSGTKRYSRAVGTLVMGPLTESSFTNCGSGNICTSWTDSGALGGTLRRVAPRHPR